MMDAKTDFRFTTKTKPNPDTEIVHGSRCIDWIGGAPRGYGLFRVENRCVPAHRYLYEAIHGPVRRDQVIRHLCNRPSCVNPDHLAVGSHQDNADDREAAGRTYCKLDDRAVTTIVGRALLGHTQKAIATDYGVVPSEVAHIINGRRRANALDPELDRELAKAPPAR